VVSEERPQLTDGVVLLRPWREDDVEAAVAGHDEEIAYWFGAEEPASYAARPDLVAKWHRSFLEDPATAAFAVEHDGQVVGGVAVRDRGDGIGDLRWWLYGGQRGRGHATRAVRLLVDHALRDLGMERVEARVDPENQRSLRVATRAGLRREGVVRGRHERPESTGYVLLGRLAGDPPITEPESFRALLNSFLPRKRAIAQMLVRDAEDRVLLCRLTYKSDWDLPGGVVEVGESPRLAVAREVEEELGLSVDAGDLLLTDWLPAWSGWDDALCLVFDGGVHPPSLVDRVVEQPREIRSAQFCDLAEVRANCADFTARRIESALRALREGGPSSYTESGRF
jgi:RimJ/RimL family protein N-acetyltransferase/ADP-ribose pyrophosphatase YjhB (NUDIX family)